MMSVRRATRDLTSENQLSRSLDGLTESPVKASPSHDVGPAPQDAGRYLSDFHDPEQTHRPFRVIEKKIDVGVLARFVANRRSEEVKVVDPELPELGLVRLQPS